MGRMKYVNDGLRKTIQDILHMMQAMITDWEKGYKELFAKVMNSSGNSV